VLDEQVVTGLRSKYGQPAEVRDSNQGAAQANLRQLLLVLG